MERTQPSIDQQLSAIKAGIAGSDQKIRELLVELILYHIEGKVTLSFVLDSIKAIYPHMKGKLTPDLFTAITSLAELADHVNTKTPDGFMEHQKIEDQLVSILHQLQQ